MSYSKSIAIVFTTFVCATALAVDAGAQSRGGSGGHSSGGHATAVGHAAPRAVSTRVVGTSHVVVGAPLYSHYYPYYGYRPGFSIGFGYGYPYYYGAYGYPYYGAYGYPYYGGYYPYAYPAYPTYPPAYGGTGYVVPQGSAYGPQGSAYGGVRIQGAPRAAEVYVDGGYAGVVDDHDGIFQRLDLQPGSHEIEIRTTGHPMTYDVNVAAGQTVTIHANVH